MDSTDGNMTSDLSIPNNGTDSDAHPPVMTGRDASWILTSAVIIFTMQTGFGLLESGCVKPKSEINIMMKNALDVVFGGITYWAFGYGMSFGDGPLSNSFIGVGKFFFDSDGEQAGFQFADFLFQLSFSTTATTIVSGCMAERVKLHSYIVFSLLNTVVYCIPAHWLWATKPQGWLLQMGAIDVAGCGPVHLVGGVTGLVGALLIKPRLGIFKEGAEREGMPSPVKGILGTFMLWWGWLRFNSGSVFIISDELEWHKAVRAAVTTIMSSMGGGMMAVILSLTQAHFMKTPDYDVGILLNSLLGSLVSITSVCTLCRPWHSVVIGMCGAVIAWAVDHLVYKLRIDDPVGVIPVHMACGMWGLFVVGLFVPADSTFGWCEGTGGLFITGEWRSLGAQTAAIFSILAWTLVTAYLLLKIIDLTLGLRLSEEEETIGPDACEHGVYTHVDKELMDLGEGLLEGKKDLTSFVDASQHDEAFRRKLLGLFEDITTLCDNDNVNVQLALSCVGENRIAFDLAINPNKEPAPEGSNKLTPIGGSDINIDVSAK